MHGYQHWKYISHRHTQNWQRSKVIRSRPTVRKLVCWKNKPNLHAIKEENDLFGCRSTQNTIARLLTRWLVISKIWVNPPECTNTPFWIPVGCFILKWSSNSQYTSQRFEINLHNTKRRSSYRFKINKKWEIFNNRLRKINKNLRFLNIIQWSIIPIHITKKLFLKKIVTKLWRLNDIFLRQ